MGVTGILREYGTFLSCEKGNHYIVADTIPQNEECVYFSAYKDSIDSIVYFPEKLTKEQVNWIITHIDSLDEGQYNQWICFLKENSFKILKH